LIKFGVGNQWRSEFFLCSGRVITMAAPNRKYQLQKSQLFTDFSSVWLNSLKFMNSRNIFQLN
jgi:hypothetical protein